MKKPFRIHVIFLILISITGMVAPIGNGYSASLPRYSDDLQCDPSPEIVTEENLSPQNGVCDAPIVFVIDVLDYVTTKIVGKCIATISEKAPGYAKDLNVLSSLLTGNPVAMGLALGAAAAGDLKECSIEGAFDSLPDSIRLDMKNVYNSMTTTSEYKSLVSKMRKLGNMSREDIDSGAIRDSYLGRRDDVEDINKEIVEISKSLAERLQKGAEEISVLEKGIISIKNLFNKGREVYYGLDEIAEQVRASARNDTASCRLENADMKIAESQKIAQRSLFNTLQAISNAREKRVCIAEQLQPRFGNQSGGWIQNVNNLGSPGDKMLLSDFYEYQTEIEKLGSLMKQQVLLIQRFAQNCKLVHQEQESILQDKITYQEIISYLDKRLSEKSLCDFNELTSKQISHLESIETDKCGWRMPRSVNNKKMSEEYLDKILARKRNVDVDLQLLDSLKEQFTDSIEIGEYQKAEDYLLDLEQLSKHQCIDGSAVTLLKTKLQTAKENAQNNVALQTTPEDKADCVNISSQKGWQQLSIPQVYNGILIIEGGWNVHLSHPLAGPEGYKGALEERMHRQYSKHKYVKTFPFAALLMRQGASGSVNWVKDKYIAISSGGKLQFRINDNDDALGDNKGSLKLCFKDKVTGGNGSGVTFSGGDVQGVWNTIHTHKGCSSSKNFCDIYSVPLHFSKDKSGQIIATWPGYSLRGMFDDTIYKYEIYNGGKHHGKGEFKFDTGYKSFKGIWNDNYGHKGTWTGRRDIHENDAKQ